MTDTNYGMLHIYYGYGRGKTSILNGTALRARGANLRVGYWRFLKGRLTSEDALLRQCGIAVFKVQSSPKFVIQMQPDEVAQTQQEVDIAFGQIQTSASQYDLILLDELLDLVDTKLKTPGDLVALLQPLHGQVEILVSGHKKIAALFALADLITYIHNEKHYYDTHKLLARQGIEF